MCAISVLPALLHYSAANCPVFHTLYRHLTQSTLHSGIEYSFFPFILTYHLHFSWVYPDTWLMQVTIMFKRGSLCSYWFTLPITGFTQYHGFVTHFPWEFPTRHYVKSVDIPYNASIISCSYFLKNFASFLSLYSFQASFYHFQLSPSWHLQSSWQHGLTGLTYEPWELLSTSTGSQSQVEWILKNKKKIKISLSAC